MKKLVLKLIELMVNAAVIGYSAICALLMSAMPLNKFEWMLTDPALGSEPMTFCSLPLDDNIESPLALMLLVPLLLAFLVLSMWKGKLHFSLWLLLFLLAMWVLCFFIFVPSCPDHTVF